MAAIALVAIVLFVITVLVVARQTWVKLKEKLKKAGVQLSWGSISHTSVKSISVVLEKGPLKGLTIDSIAWGAAARTPQAAAGPSTADGSEQRIAAAAWLPIRITGLCLVVGSSTCKASTIGPRASQRQKAHSKARAAATLSAVSTALAVAKRLLPHLPVKLQKVTVDLQGQGLRLELKGASVQWAVDHESALISTVLLQSLSLSAGIRVESPSVGSQLSSVCCPLAKMSVGLGPGRGFLPVVCTHLALQVGQIRVMGLSQLLVLAAAAASPRQPASLGKHNTTCLDNQLPPQHSQHSTAATTTTHSKVVIPGNVAGAVALLPNKVKVGFAGVTVQPCTAFPAGTASLQALPQLQGSIGAISLAASSCRQPTAVQTNGKLLSMSATLGPVQLKAAVQTAGNGSHSSESPAVEFDAAGVALAADLVKTLNAAAKSSTAVTPAAEMGPLQRHLPGNQQAKQHQLTASCDCKITDAPSVKICAHQIPKLVEAAKLLQLSLHQLRQEPQAAATAGSECRPGVADEQLLPRTSSLSPSHSISHLPRVETPNLETPWSTEAQQTPKGVESSPAKRMGGPLSDGSSRLVPGSVPQSPAAASTAAVDTLLASIKKCRPVPAEYTSIALEATAAVEKGINIEVLDSNKAAIAWLSLQQLECSARVDWVPEQGSSSSSRHHAAATAAAGLDTRSTFALAACLNMQQVTIRIAPATGAASRPAMQQLLMLDVVDVKASGANGIPSTTAASNESPALPTTDANGVVACDVTIAAGQLKLAPNPEMLAALLQLLQQAYVVPAKAVSTASRLGTASSTSAAAAPAAAAQPSSLAQRSRYRRFAVTSVDMTMQSAVLSYTCDMPVCQEFAKASTGEAAAKGLQSQVMITATNMQVSMHIHKYVAASMHSLQVGYHVMGSSTQRSPDVGSIELLLMQGVEVRRYCNSDLHLLKIALQQLRSDVHIDAAVACAGMADAALQQVAASAHQLQQQHATRATSIADQQGAARNLAAAASAAAGKVASTKATQSQLGLMREDSFTALAGRASPTDSEAPSAAAASWQQAGLPPLPYTSVNGYVKVRQEQRQHKPLLALETRLQDVAVQLSVGDRDALMVQLELVKYSSVLEQCVVERLQFSINERSVVQIPHLAVHHLPGWLSTGAAAAAAALGQQQRAWSPDRAYSGISTAAASSIDEVGLKPCSIPADEVTSKAPADNSPGGPERQPRRLACSASYESVRFCDDGGVQSWQSIDDPVPSASLGSQRPANTKDPGLYQRQAARQQASRERCKVSLPTADSSGAVKSSEVISLDVYAERVLFSVPHDEAPGRIILLCETWAKAVKQVLLSQVDGIKTSLSALKAAQTVITASHAKPTAPAKASGANKNKPAYLELQAHLQQIVFCLEQDPLETWMGLHGPVLQAMAAERHLVEQLLASCSSAHGRISRTGESGTGGMAKNNEATGQGLQLRAGGGKKQRGQWQKRRWGSLGKRSTPITDAIGAGSVTQAALAAAAGPAAAAIAATAPGASPRNPGRIIGQAQAPHAATATTRAAAEDRALEADDSKHLPPAIDDSAAYADLHSEPEAASEGEAPSQPPTAEDHVDNDSSEELDSSEEDDTGLMDPDALAAVLPSSASALAGGDAAAAAGPAGVKKFHPAHERVQDSLRAAAAGDKGTNNEMQQAVLQAHTELFSIYKFRCRPLHAAREDVYHPSRAVMHISVAKAEAVVLICLPGHAASADMAREVISRVDPASEGVGMDRFQSISLDVGMQDLVAHFGGVEEMASTIGHLGASGLLIRARQMCAPPQTRSMRMSVGTWHEADVPVVVKGTRPPMKMYTDVKAELDDVQGAFCPGLEAPFGQLNAAFKRITVPSSLIDLLPAPAQLTLPWWDMMGYMWRGVACVRIRGLTAVLANTQNPHVGVRDEKLALTAATLSIAVAAGKIDVTTTNMSALAHAAAPDAAPGDSLLVLPAFHLPLATLTFKITNKLPGGRNPLLHHCFPIHAQPPGPNTPPQGAVDVFSLMKSEGWCLAIDIVVNSDKTATAGTAVWSRTAPGLAAAGHGPAGGVGGSTGAAGSGGASRCSSGFTASSAAGRSGVAASCWHYYQPYSIPHAFIGEFQIKYIIDMVDTLANPTAVVRLSRKLKPYHGRDRRPEAVAAAKALAAARVQIVQMPLLKQKVDISLTADVFRVHHDAQDSEDPSDMVYIALSSVRYMNTFTYSRYQRTQKLSTGSRLKDSMRQYMASLTVEAYDLKIVSPQGDQLSAMLGSVTNYSGQAGGATSSGLQTPTGGRKPAAAPTQGATDHVDRVQHMLDTKTPSRRGAGGAGVGSPSRGSPLKGQSRDRGGSSDEDSDVPGFSQGLIAAAACFLLRQAPAEGGTGGEGAPTPLTASAAAIPVDPPPVPKRPIHMIAQDVKLLCPAELRDTLMLLFHHMQKAFSGISFGQPRGPERINTKQQQQQQAGGPGDGTGRADSVDVGGNLGRSSAPVGSGGAGPSEGATVGRRASTDTAFAASPADGGAVTLAASTSAAVSGTSSSMVSTPFEEEVMLQKILQENQAAAASKARLLADKRAGSSDNLSACSTGSKGSGTTAADAAVPSAVDRDGSMDVSEAAAGTGHAAVAARAVTGAVGPNKPELSMSTATEDATSDSASRPGVEGSSPRHQSGAAGSPEEVLLEYEIQFVQVQVNLVSDSARGSLVLGTNSAQLLGHLNVSKLERSVSFKMDQVQAHVVCTDKDPQQGPLWLEIANGKLSTPPDAQAVMRQVLLPFKCQLVTTKQATNSATAAALSSSSTQAQGHPPLQQQQHPQQRPGRTSSVGGLPPAGFAPSAAQELRLHVPSIGARLDSRQFEVLMDVIQNIAMAPLPTFPPSVRSMWRHPDGTSEDDDNQDVQIVLETLQSLRERQRGLEQELATIWQAHQHYQQLQHQYAWLAGQQHCDIAARCPGSAATVWDTGSSSHVEAISDYSGRACSTAAAVSSVTIAQQQGLSCIPVTGNKAEAYVDVKEAVTALVTALAQTGAAHSQLAAPGTLPRSSTTPAAISSGSGSLRADGVGGSHGTLGSVSRGNFTGASHSATAALQQLNELSLVSQRQTLVWWTQDRLQGALDAITATRVVLNLLRGEAGLLKVRQRDSMGVGLTVDTIDWALSKGNTVIVQGELQGISYQSIRSEDHTGTTKIQLHTATFRDPKAAAAAAAASSSSSSKGHSSSQHHHVSDPLATEASSAHSTAGTGSAGSSNSAAVLPARCSTPSELRESAAAAADSNEGGIILAPWNPDESWERDELVRIYAIHGALEKRHVVYEHIEVLVHPIRVHLTAALASALQDYFNLRDEDSKLQTGAAGKGARHAAIREDKRRATAPGDLLATPGSLSAAGSASNSASSKSRAAAGGSSHLATNSSAAGPLVAAAPRNRPSIFHRRAAAAASAAAQTTASVAATAAPAGAASNISPAAAAAAQPQIVVPPVDIEEVGIRALDVGKTSSLAVADSPATQVPAELPAPGLEAAESAAVDASSVAAADVDGAALCSSQVMASAAESGHYAAGAVVVAPASPGPCVQPVSAEAALMMRYGAVLRGRAGRIAASSPSTPVGSAGGAVGPGAPASAAGAGGSSGGHGAGGAGSGAMTPASAAGGPLTPGGGAGTAAVKKPARSIMFKHIRFNRMHARLTYEGPPLSISGFGLVLDNRVYRNIDGGWTTVLNRYKWDAIRSLVKSLSGLQARKLQELQIPNFGAEPPDTMDALRSSSGFKAGLMSLLKGKRPAGGGKLQLNGVESAGGAGAGEYGSIGDDGEGGVRDGTVGGGDEASAGGAEGLGAGSDYMVLMRDALRAKHKAKKIALLLGTVPPLPHKSQGHEI